MADLAEEHIRTSDSASKEACRLVQGPALVENPEVVAHSVRRWLSQAGVNTLFLAKSSPWENGYVESFNGKLRDELLNRELFLGSEDARWVIDHWRLDDNHQRRHSALDYQTPAAFAANCVLQDSATLNPSDHSPTTEPGFSHSGWYNDRGSFSTLEMWAHKPIT